MEIPKPKGWGPFIQHDGVVISQPNPNISVSAMMIKGSGCVVIVERTNSQHSGFSADFIPNIGVLEQVPFIMDDAGVEKLVLPELTSYVLTRDGPPPGQLQKQERQVERTDERVQAVLAERRKRLLDEAATKAAQSAIKDPPKPVKKAAKKKATKKAAKKKGMKRG